MTVQTSKLLTSMPGRDLRALSRQQLDGFYEDLVVEYWGEGSRASALRAISKVDTLKGAYMGVAAKLESALGCRNGGKARTRMVDAWIDDNPASRLNRRWQGFNAASLHVDGYHVWYADQTFSLPHTREIQANLDALFALGYVQVEPVITGRKSIVQLMRAGNLASDAAYEAGVSPGEIAEAMQRCIGDQRGNMGA